MVPIYICVGLAGCPARPSPPGRRSKSLIHPHPISTCGQDGGGGREVRACQGGGMGSPTSPATLGRGLQKGGKM